MAQIAQRHGVAILPGPATSNQGGWADHLRLPYIHPPTSFAKGVPPGPGMGGVRSDVPAKAQHHAGGRVTGASGIPGGREPGGVARSNVIPPPQEVMCPGWLVTHNTPVVEQEDGSLS